MITAFQENRLAICLCILVHLFMPILCSHEKNPVEVFYRHGKLFMENMINTSTKNYPFVKYVKHNLFISCRLSIFTENV